MVMGPGGYRFVDYVKAGITLTVVVFVLILLPLLFYGGGKISLDHLLLKLTGRDSYVSDQIGDGIAAALVFAILGVTTIFLEPAWGVSLIVIAVVLGLTPALRR